MLFLHVVELVDDRANSFGEVVDSSAKLVPAGERAAFLGEAGAFGLQVPLAGREVAGAALEFGEFDEAGLVDVDQSSAFPVGGGDLAVEAGEFGGEQFVVGDRGGHRDGLFACQQHFGLGERGADLVEHERVEGVGADVAFRAAAVLAARADRVVVAAVVVAVSGAVAAAHFVAVGADPADTAFDQALE